MIQFSNFTPEVIGKTDTSTIIDTERYNGQINLFKQPDPNAFFKMQERVAIKNKSTEYREALSGNDLEANPLSNAFFSAENIQILQNGLRAGVYKQSGERKIVVPPQNTDQLKIIMRSVYLQYAEHHLNAIRDEITKLNYLVLDYAIPNVYNEAMGYLKYLEDKSTLVVPLNLPARHDRVYKQLEPLPFVYSPAVYKKMKEEEDARTFMQSEASRKLGGGM